MRRRPHMGRRHPHLFLFLFALFFSSCSTRRAGSAAAMSSVHVGVILDLKKESLLGRMCDTSLAMAIEDFYANHPNHTTRVVLHTRDSNNDAVGAAAAAVDLMKNVRVEAIIGPLTSVQSVFVANLGNKSNVPIVSFSASSPSLSSVRSPYFVRAALNSSSQVAAIAAIVRAFGWRDVIPVYEDTEYGTGFLPYLVDAFQAIDVRVPRRSAISPSASEANITSELNSLKDQSTRVFVAHTLPSLGSRLFRCAKKLGMMEKEYVWITTDGLTDLLGTLDPDVFAAMQGVIGIKPHVPLSLTKDFLPRWTSRFRRDNPDATNVNGTSIYALWAYDAAWAMAMAVEKVGLTNSSTFKTSTSGSTDLTNLGVSLHGPRLLEALRETNFAGLSGKFHLVDGQLQASTFQVVNVVGHEARLVGLWAPQSGLRPKSNSTRDTNGTPLHGVIWPGAPKKAPKGWQMPTNTSRKMRIAIPAKPGFAEFVDKKGCRTGEPCPDASGYSIEVFNSVMRSLNYTGLYEFFTQGDTSSYDELVQKVYAKEYDGAVGDITIVANRSQYVDFTLPYTESGVAMIVPLEKNKNKNAWIFLKPLTKDLWLGSLAFFVFTGFVVWVIEHRINDEFRGPPAQQMGTIFYFAFSTIVYAHRERLASNLSRFVVIIWVFVVLILTSSYTASLTSMLTVQQLQPTVTDVNQLRKNGDRVGYQEGSFTQGLLLSLRFEESNLVALKDQTQYEAALKNGTAKGGVAAIFDEFPYIKVFMEAHCKDYFLIGPISKTDGFGFVFPVGSPLVPEISRAILNITETNEKLQSVETYMGRQDTCGLSQQADSNTSSRLSFSSFWGLFLITGVTSFLALLIYFVAFLRGNWRDLRSAASTDGSVGQKMMACIKRYDQKDLSSHTFKEGSSRGGSKGCDCGSQGRRTPVSYTMENGWQSPTSMSNHSYAIGDPPEDAAGSFVSPAATPVHHQIAPPASDPPTIPVTQTRD